jgi:Ca2+-binding EF-hand superfamily protein
LRAWAGWQEIEAFFKQFDKDGSGRIERKELKACLFSLGEELTTAQVEAYMTQFGTGASLNLSQFRELMIHLIGVIHTQPSILASFEFIGHDAQTVRLAKEEELWIGHAVQPLAAWAMLYRSKWIA